MTTTWHATSGTSVTIRIEAGNFASAVLELGKVVGGVSQPPIAQGQSPLTHSVLLGPGLHEFYISAVGADVGGANVPLVHSVSQGGHILRADDGIPPTINLPPYQPVPLAPDAQHNAPTFYFFDVRVV